jgi:hypothetical protein
MGLVYGGELFRLLAEADENIKSGNSGAALHAAVQATKLKLTELQPDPKDNIAIGGMIRAVAVLGELEIRPMTAEPDEQVVDCLRGLRHLMGTGDVGAALHAAVQATMLALHGIDASDGIEKIAEGELVTARAVLVLFEAWVEAQIDW